MTTLPTAASFTGATVTEAQFKTALTSLRAYLSEILGIDGGLRAGRNGVVNGGCTIAQRPEVSLATTLAIGKVDRIAVDANASTVSAGTITQAADTFDLGRTGQLLRIEAATWSGGAGQLTFRHRMRSENSVPFRNRFASVSVKVRHDVGSAHDWDIVISKADALNDFSTVTLVTSGGTTSVSSDTSTTVKLEAIVMGDVTNGIEIKVRALVGADVTAKNFWITEWQIELGQVATPFDYEDQAATLIKCQRHYFKTFPQATAPNTNAGAAGSIMAVASGTASSTAVILQADYPVAMWDDPTIVTYNPSAANALIRAIDTTGDIAVTVSGNSDDRACLIVNNAAVVDGDRHIIHMTAEVEL